MAGGKEAIALIPGIWAWLRERWNAPSLLKSVKQDLDFLQKTWALEKKQLESEIRAMQIRLEDSQSKVADLKTSLEDCNFMRRSQVDELDLIKHRSRKEAEKNQAINDSLRERINDLEKWLHQLELRGLLRPFDSTPDVEPKG